MTFKLIIDPKNEKTMLNLAQMPQKIKRGIRRGAYLSGKKLVRETRNRINDKPKSGRTYTIYTGIGGKALRRPRKHIASAAGEAPAVISGSLRKSVDFKVRGNKRLDFGAGSSSVEYARILEVGGSTGRGRIAPRLYLLNATRKLGNKIKAILEREVTKLIK